MIKSKPKSEEDKKRVGRPIEGRVLVTLRLDPDIVNFLRQGGRGWGARANTTLRRALKMDA